MVFLETSGLSVEAACSVRFAGISREQIKTGAVEIERLVLDAGIKFLVNGVDDWFRNDRDYIAAIMGDKVVGVACYVETSSVADTHMGLGYLSVAPEFKNKGIGSALAERLILRAKEIGKSLYVTAYEAEGSDYLKPKLEMFAAAHGVDLDGGSFVRSREFFETVLDLDNGLSETDLNGILSKMRDRAAAGAELAKQLCSCMVERADARGLSDCLKSLSLIVESTGVSPEILSEMDVSPETRLMVSVATDSIGFLGCDKTKPRGDASLVALKAIGNMDEALVERLVEFVVDGAVDEQGEVRHVIESSVMKLATKPRQPSVRDCSRCRCR